MTVLHYRAAPRSRPFFLPMAGQPPTHGIRSSGGEHMILLRDGASASSAFGCLLSHVECPTMKCCSSYVPFVAIAALGAVACPGDRSYSAGPAARIQDG